MCESKVVPKPCPKECKVIEHNKVIEYKCKLVS